MVANDTSVNVFFTPVFCFYPIIFSSNSSLMRHSIWSSQHVRVLHSFAWNTIFLTAFTLVGEPLRPHCSGSPYRPLVQSEIGTLIIQFGVRHVGRAFEGHGGVLVFHHEFCVARTAGRRASVYGYYDGHGGFYRLHTLVGDLNKLQRQIETVTDTIKLVKKYKKYNL